MTAGSDGPPPSIFGSERDTGVTARHSETPSWGPISPWLERDSWKGSYPADVGTGRNLLKLRGSTGPLKWAAN